MEGEKDNGGVSEQQLELARLAKEAFDHHRYWCKGDQHVHAGLSNLLGKASSAPETCSSVCLDTRAVCLP